MIGFIYKPSLKTKYKKHGNKFKLLRQDISHQKSPKHLRISNRWPKTIRKKKKIVKWNKVRLVLNLRS